MRRPQFVVALMAASLAVAPAAPAATSQTQRGDLISKAEFTLSTKKPNAPASIKIHLSHDLTTGVKQPQAFSLDVATPKGTKINPDVAEICELATLESTGSCPSDTLLGSGTARARVDSGGISSLDVSGVKPYRVANSNCKGGSKLCVAIHAEDNSTGVVTNIIVAVSGGSQPHLVAENFTLPTVFDIVPILIDGNFTINKSTKIKGKKTSLLTTPRKCSGSWSISETRNYDGFGDVSTTTKVPCSKK